MPLLSAGDIPLIAGAEFAGEMLSGYRQQQIRQVERGVLILDGWDTGVAKGGHKQTGVSGHLAMVGRGAEAAYEDTPSFMPENTLRLWPDE